MARRLNMHQTQGSYFLAASLAAALASCFWRMMAASLQRLEQKGLIRQGVKAQQRLQQALTTREQA